MMSEELNRLRELHDEGVLSDEEYAAAKQRLLNQSSSLTAPDHPQTTVLLGFTPSTYAMILHLSQYAGYIVPFAGLVIPIAMWLYGRDHSEFVDAHGRALMNFLITYTIYAVSIGILFLIVIGLIFVPIFLIVTLILPLVAAIAASKGQTYRYPATISFF